MAESMYVYAPYRFFSFVFMVPKTRLVKLAHTHPDGR